jgi:hypothetical protein
MNFKNINNIHIDHYYIHLFLTVWIHFLLPREYTLSPDWSKIPCGERVEERVLVIFSLIEGDKPVMKNYLKFRKKNFLMKDRF